MRTRIRNALARPLRQAAPRCLLALLALLLLSCTAQAASISETARQVLSNSAYQTELPSQSLPEVSSDPNFDDYPPDQWSLSLPGWLFKVGELLLLCLLGAVVLAVVARIVRLLLDRNRGSAEDEPRQSRQADAAIPANVATPTLREADELAAEGRFAEAAHLLLGAALAYLKQRVAPGLAESLTSREVIAAVDLNQDRRSALLSIVDAVEVSHFGNHPLDGSGYGHCRACFTFLTGNTAASA